jgi:hypothetical protein
MSNAPVGFGGLQANIHEAMRAHRAIVAEMPPNLSRRAEMLLEFWFAPEGTAERDRLRDIWLQATPEFDAALTKRFHAGYGRAAAGVYGRSVRPASVSALPACTSESRRSAIGRYC